MYKKKLQETYNFRFPRTFMNVNERSQKVGIHDRGSI